MGIRYRKTFKAGPVRVTASKSGISYSAGVKGARITKRADGRGQTTLSAPRTGLRYTTTTTFHAGYLSREIAGAVQPALMAFTARSGRNVACPARILWHEI